MTILDLGKPFDLALATGSALSELVLLFGRDPREWDIVEASYNDVSFHVMYSKQEYGASVGQIRDTGGRRLAEFKFPYQDGQTTDDLGRSPEQFDMEIVFYGQYYQNGLNKLFKELQKPEPGRLIHPVRGYIPQCKMRSYTLTHSHDQRSAVLCSVTFIEHNFNLSSYGKMSVATNFDSILSDAIGSFKVIQSIYNQIVGALYLYNSVKNILTNLVEAFDLNLRSSLAQMVAVFAKNGTFTLPSIVPVNRGGTLKSDGTLTQTTFPTAVATNDPFRDVPIDQINAQIAAAASAFSSFNEDQPVLSTGTDVTTPGLAALASISTAIAATYIQNTINALREEANTLIKSLQAAQNNNPNLLPLGEQSDGSLIFYNGIQDLKRAMILYQNAYEAGMKQNRAILKRYTTPRLMSLREVAFANGLTPDRVVELDLLNPELDSINYIPAGTEVLVAA